MLYAAGIILIKDKIYLTFLHILCYHLPMFPRYIEDDGPIVEACIKKDAAAWAVLVKKYSGLISASIANRLKKYGFDPVCEDTEEMRQNVLTSIWTDGKLEKVRNRKNIAYWISIVAGNAAIEEMRKKASGENPKFVPICDTFDMEAADLETPAKKELSEAIERSIGRLPPKEQMVAKLNLLHGVEYREIAEMLNMPKGTVSSCIKRAKEKLMRELKDF